VLPTIHRGQNSSPPAWTVHKEHLAINDPDLS
jgi:hypothetical protein